MCADLKVENLPSEQITLNMEITERTKLLKDIHGVDLCCSHENCNNYSINWSIDRNDNEMIVVGHFFYQKFLHLLLSVFLCQTLSYQIIRCNQLKVKQSNSTVLQ